MTEKKEIMHKIDTLYKNQNSKKFLLHLVRAYTPLNKPKKVFNKPEKLSKFKCALTNAKLISVDEVLELINTEDYNKAFMDDLKKMSGLLLEDNKHSEKHISETSKLTNNRILGYQGEESTTYLCQEGIEVLYEWTCNMVLKGDSSVNWALGNKTKKKPNKKKPVMKKSVTKLGDLGVLGDLKKKMEASEKK